MAGAHRQRQGCAPDRHERVPYGRSCRHTIDATSVHDMHALRMDDLDADGVPEVITREAYPALGTANDQPPLVYYVMQRDASGTTFEPHVIDPASGAGRAFVVQDLNGDCRPDIVVRAHGVLALGPLCANVAREPCRAASGPAPDRQTPTHRSAKSVTPFRSEKPTETPSQTPVTPFRSEKPTEKRSQIFDEAFHRCTTRRATAPVAPRPRSPGPSGREECEGGDLNPHGSYPASTSS